MATVRMSKSLKAKIAGNAASLFNKRIIRAEKLPDGFGDRCYQAWLDMGHCRLIEEIQKFGSELTESWLELENSFEVATINDVGVGQVVSLSDRQYMPKLRYFRFRMDLRGEHCEPLKQMFLRWQENLTNVKSRQDRFVQDIKEFLDTMPTLNRALQVFPGLREIVDPHDAAKVTPSKRAYHAHPDVRATVERLTGEIVQAKILEV